MWKDVDGVLSADPREVEGTVPMAFLSFQEATELAYFGAQVLHPQSMRPAMDSDKLCVRVKNSYNVRAPGTLIGHVRPGGNEDWLLTSIVRKSNVTMLDIVSTRMLVGPARKILKTSWCFTQHTMTKCVEVLRAKAKAKSMDQSRARTGSEQF